MIVRYYNRLYEYVCGLTTGVAYSSTFIIVRKIDIISFYGQLWHNTRPCFQQFSDGCDFHLTWNTLLTDKRHIFSYQSYILLFVICALSCHTCPPECCRPAPCHRRPAGACGWGIGDTLLGESANHCENGGRARHRVWRECHLWRLQICEHFRFTLYYP